MRSYSVILPKNRRYFAFQARLLLLTIIIYGCTSLWNFCLIGLSFFWKSIVTRVTFQMIYHFTRNSIIKTISPLPDFSTMKLI